MTLPHANTDLREVYRDPMPKEARELARIRQPEGAEPEPLKLSERWLLVVQALGMGIVLGEWMSGLAHPYLLTLGAGLLGISRVLGVDGTLMARARAEDVVLFEQYKEWSECDCGEFFEWR